MVTLSFLKKYYQKQRGGREIISLSHSLLIVVPRRINKKLRLFDCTIWKLATTEPNHIKVELEQMNVALEIRFFYSSDFSSFLKTHVMKISSISGV